MSPAFYQVLHVLSLIVLTGYTFYAFAGPAPETRKKVLMMTGIASVLMLVSGFGLVSKLYQNHIAGWMIVKFVCWIGLSALSGIAYRRRGKTGMLTVVALVLVLVALVMVFYKPF